ncbi:hypothetical protein ACJX0J_000093 [Zea mays]
MIVNMGPQHPSMHGMLIDCEPILGYLHRGMEKIAENRSIIQYLPYVTRLDYLATMFTEAITSNYISEERVEGVGFICGEEAVNWGLSRRFAVEKIPGGPYENLENPEWNDFEYRFLGKKPSPNFELSKQELYVRVEAPKGELGIYLVGDDSLFPWRWKLVTPGFINLQILPQLVKKMKLAVFMTILGSIDIIMGKLIVEMIIDRVEDIQYLYLINFEGLGTLKIPHELMPNSFHLLIDEINSEASRMKLRFHVRSSTSKYGFFGWNLWRQPIGFLVIKPNILVLNMVYFILFLT